MTVWTDLKEQDRVTIEAAVALALGKKPDVSSVMGDDGAGEYPIHQVAVYEINKDNLREFVTKLAPEGWADLKDIWPDDAKGGK